MGQTNAEPDNETVILLLTTHRQCGPILVPVKVIRESPGWLTVQNRLLGKLPPDQGIENLEICNEIILLSDSFSDSEIHRRFARKGVSMKDFLKSPSDELLSLQIRPFIDRQMDKMLKLAIQCDIPVYADGGSPRLYPETNLLLTPNPADPWFCFTKTAEGSNYILEIYQDEVKIGLNSAGNKIVCHKPCWFRAGNRLLHFEEGFDGKKLEPFLKKAVILIPAQAEKKYFETFIMKTLRTGQVRAEGFSVKIVNPSRRMELSAELDWQNRAVLVVFFRYGEKRIMSGKSQKTFIDLKMEGTDVVFYKTERQGVWENGVISDCLSMGLVKLNENTLGLPGASGVGNLDLYRIAEWLNSHARELQDHGIVICTDRSPLNFFTGSISDDIRVEPGEDWFDVKAVVYVGDLEVPFIQLRHYILEGIREFPLPGGQIVILPREWFTRYSDLFYFAEVIDHNLRLHLHHGQIIRELDAPQNSDPKNNLMLPGQDYAKPAVAPATLNATLRPYQLEGLQWLMFLHDYRFGGCLADDMGLGKTIQALALLLTCNNEVHPASLIVMPASLIHNWRNEIRRFAPSLSILEHIGNQRMSSTGFFSSIDVILTTYGTLRNDLELLLTYRFYYIILDESQVIKNPAAQISRAVCQLKSERRLVLTGTPVENSLSDLWSQMQFLNPGLLGPLAAFQKRYGSLRGQAESTLITRSEASEPAVNQDSLTASERVKRLVAPFIMRRTKSEVEPDLPPLTLEEWYCEMTDDQSSRYEEEKSAVRNEVLQQLETGETSETSLMILKALIRLRQVANHPCLVDPGYTGGSGKFEEIIRIAEALNAEGHKTLIFSSFVKHLQLIAGYFNREGIPYSMLIGATTKREDVIVKFQKDPTCQFFLISLKAGGAGLNLTEAGYVMLLDPWWNPAAELQAINRAHRIGQDKKVIAYKFITSGTIEEKMLVLQQKKQFLSDAFVPAGNPLKDLSREEIREMFG